MKLAHSPNVTRRLAVLKFLNYEPWCFDELLLNVAMHLGLDPIELDPGLIVEDLMAIKQAGFELCTRSESFGLLWRLTPIRNANQLATAMEKLVNS